MKREKGWCGGTVLLRYYCCRCDIFATFVTEGRVAGDLCLAVWTRFESELFASDVLVHALGEFGVAQ